MTFFDARQQEIIHGLLGAGDIRQDKIQSSLNLLFSQGANALTHNFLLDCRNLGKVAHLGRPLNFALVNIQALVK